LGLAKNLSYLMTMRPTGSIDVTPHFPRIRSGHRLFQRPSPQKQIPSSKNEAEEVKWYRKVVDRGLPEARPNLGPRRDKSSSKYSLAV
jgi:hypothetical protein